LESYFARGIYQTGGYFGTAYIDTDQVSVS
jgi:hypothetical protein